MALGKKSVQEMSVKEKDDLARSLELARRSVKVPANVVPLGKVAQGDVTPSAPVISAEA